MIDYTPTPTNFYEDYICHYGIKGMKWKRHKYASDSDAYKRLNAMGDDEYWSRVKAAKLVGKKGSSSKSAKASAGKKEGSGKAAKEKKEKETKKKTIAERDPIMKQQSHAAVSNILSQFNLQKDKSQLPKAREKAAELEKRKKKNGGIRLYYN